MSHGADDEERDVTMEVGERGNVVRIVDGDVEVVRWQLDPTAEPDLQTVDSLCRLRLEARRRGWTVRLDAPSDAFCGLLRLVGLADLLLEPGGQPELLEDLRSDEVVEGGDPTV